MIDSVTKKIIKILLNEKEPITTQQLAFRIGSSQSGIKQRLNHIREIVENHNGHFDSTPSIGISIKINPKFKHILELFLESKKDFASSSTLRFIYIAECLLTYPSEYTLSLFSEELDTGKYLIRKDLAAVEAWLQKYDLNLVRIPSAGLRVEGEEEKFRIALIKLMRRKFKANYLPDPQKEQEFQINQIYDVRISYEFYEFFKYIYEEKKLKTFQDMLLDVEAKADFSLSTTSFTQMIEYLSIMKFRIEDSHALKTSPTWEGVEVSLFQDIASDLIKKIVDCSYYTDDMTHEISYISACLMVFAPNHIALRYFDYKKNIPVSEEFLNSISTIMHSYFKRDYGININVALFFEKLRIQNKYSILKSSGFKHTIKATQSTLYGACVTYKDYLEASLGYRFFEEDLAYLTAILSNDLSPLDTLLKGILITAEDDNLSRYTRDYWNDVFDDIKITESVKMEHYHPSVLDDYDFGISTLRIVHPKIVNVSRLMTDDDKLLIRNFKDTILRQKDLTNKSKLTFDQNLIDCNLVFKDKTAMLEHGYALLKKNGYVNKDFWPSLLEREIKTSTFIGNHIAIPHVYLTGVLKTGVCVIKLKRLLDWNSQEKVELAFILAINIKHKDTMNEYFAAFYKLIGDKEFMNRIKEIDNCEELFFELNNAV